MFVSDTLYFFGDNNFTEWHSLFEEYKAPPFSLPLMHPAYSFGIAGIDTCTFFNPANLSFGVHKHSFSHKKPHLSFLQDQVLVSHFTGTVPATLKLSTAGRSVELYTIYS